MKCVSTEYFYNTEQRRVLDRYRHGEALDADPPIVRNLRLFVPLSEETGDPPVIFPNTLRKLSSPPLLERGTASCYRSTSTAGH
jgi:hypothetical protein